MNVSVYHTDIV